jgi:hypothetical protein
MHFPLPAAVDPTLVHASGPHPGEALLDDIDYRFRARTGDPGWRAGTVAVALPGLRFRAYLLSKMFTGEQYRVLVAGRHDVPASPGHRARLGLAVRALGCSGP